MSLPVGAAGRPQVPGHRRRGQAADPALLPRVDRPQRVRPGRGADRAVRLDTEMILYRLNQVPDRLYVKFLELVGDRAVLRGARARRPAVRARRAAPDPVRVPAGTQVSTERRATTSARLPHRPRPPRRPRPADDACLTAPGPLSTSSTTCAARGRRFTCYRPDAPVDSFYLGFGDAPRPVTSCASSVTAEPGGRRRPPDSAAAGLGGVVRRAGSGATSGRDSKRRLQPHREITLLLPPRHEPLAVGPVRAHWLRCRLVPPVPGQPAYANPPVLEACPRSLGVAGPAHHAEPAPTELLGDEHGPARPGVHGAAAARCCRDAQVRRCAWSPDGSRTSTRRRSRSGPRSPTSPTSRPTSGSSWHGATGEVASDRAWWTVTGPSVSTAPCRRSTRRCYVTGYRYGGGRRGNVAAGRLAELRTTCRSWQA